MTRLKALNESSSDDSEEDSEEKETIEAQEERAFSQYKRALELRQAGNFAEAEQLLISLLNDDFLADVCAGNQSNGADALARPAVALKYACLKNLGNVLVLQNNAEDGLKCFLQAVELDETDVSLWLQMGRIALEVDNFLLASQAFQEGLRCNPHHWPCLDALLPLLYAMNDYLGCLLLVSRTLELDPQYPQALAFKHQISKEDPSLLQNFKFFFPEENDISKIPSCLPEEEMSSFITYALSLQKRYCKENPSDLSLRSKGDIKKLKVSLKSSTWEDLGHSLLETYSAIISATDMSYLDIVEICTSEPSNFNEEGMPSSQTAEPEKPTQTSSVLNNAVDIENDVMDVDSEQDAKGEDQTEEDATEASGLDQEDETKAVSSTQQNASLWKKKKKRSSTSLMDQWSKRRSGRRSGRKAEERDESNLASCFRSLLPDSLLPRNLEAELARASRRRSLRDPVDLLALGDDSMDTEELCRLLQERDAKDEQNKGQMSEETLVQHTFKEGYFGTDLEINDVGTFVKENGNSASNIIEIIAVFILEMSKKHSLTWPLSLVPVYIEGYECMRKHVPFPCPFDESGRTQINPETLNACLLYCELIVDTWQQKNVNDIDLLRDAGLILSEALGHAMLSSGLQHIFSTPTDRMKIMLRIHWLKAHLFLLQENSPSAICSLQDVIDGLTILDKEETRPDKDVIETPLPKNSATCPADAGSTDIDESVETKVCSEETKCIDGDGNLSDSCHNNVSETDVSHMSILSKDTLAAIDKARISENVEANLTSGISPVTIEDVNQESSSVTPLAMDNEGIEEATTSKIKIEDEGTEVDLLSFNPPGEVSEEKYSNMEVDTDKTGEEVTIREPPSDNEPDKVSREKEKEIELDTNLVILKCEAISPLSDEKEGSGPGECVKSEKADESDIDEVCKEDSENVIENRGISEGINQPRDEEESDRANCEGQAEEKHELGKIAELKANNEVPNEDERVQSSITDSCAVQPNTQNEQPVMLISDEDFANSLGKVDYSSDPKTKTGISNSKLGHMSVSEDSKLEAVSVTFNENPANKPPISELKSNDDVSVDFGATIINHCPIDEDVAVESLNRKIKTVDESVNAHKPSASKSCINETVVMITKGQGSSTMCQEGAKSYVFLSNCRSNQEISKRMAQKLLTSLMRRQQLSEIDDLYTSGQYDTLASTLTECFKYCAQQADCEDPDIDDLPDRATQMAMLLDCLWQLQRYSDCFYWAEACLHESFKRYLNSNDSDNSPADQPDQPDQTDHHMWATTVERLLAGLNSCLKVAGIDVLNTLPKASLTRLVQTLTSILCHQLEHSDCSVEMAIECITPWIILHRVICFEEQKLPTYWDSIPSHVRILFTAHEYMGKKARCCLNEGVLLNLILDIVVPKISKSQDVNPKLLPILNTEVEQAILCLYGHPKKQAERNKKKLKDHKVHQHWELTWERSLSLLRFYEPEELPTFDSTGWRLSPEEEQLFLRILPLVPRESSPTRYLGNMKAFLKGSVDTLPEVQCSLPEAAWNLYYLLADFYMKTFKWEAAVKYFMWDVCLNPIRFDSWAGMALSRGTLMYQNINSCDTLNNDLQLRRMTETRQCYQMAVDLDPENSTIWIEYGNFVYTTHSLCSRLLKTETESLSMEMFTKLEEQKDKMLNITEKCFKAAEKLNQDEGWLQQYMLGKVAEKRGEDPKIFLQHYRLAAKLLFESDAEYPLTINYEPPQHYAFEAHEVHYRIHASILKHLELMEGKYLNDEVEQLYNETLLEAANGPFMAARFAASASTSNSKRSSVDPVTTKSNKKPKLEEASVPKQSSFEENKICKSDSKTTDNQQLSTASDGVMRSPSDNLTEVQTSISVLQPCLSERTVITTASATTSLRDDIHHVAITANVGHLNEKVCEVVKSSPDDARKPEGYAECQSVSNLEGQAVHPMREGRTSLINEVDTSKTAAHEREATVGNIQVLGTDLRITKDSKVLDGHEAADLCKESLATTAVNDSRDSLSSTGTSLDNNEDCNVKSDNSQMDTRDTNVPQDLTKQGNRVVSQSNTNLISNSQPLSSQPSSVAIVKSSDHVDLIRKCLFGIEECLARYPRHYKSFYRLCHHFYQSKQHRDFKKCRLLLLGDYRVLRLNKSINGLFKSTSINSMFNDVWRMPIDEIDRAGSFASHMSRCVHLLMELLRAQKDHAHLLKLSVFLKRDPEKKEKKYLRDNERYDLSKQALVMCFAAMRECANDTRTLDNVVELYRTVKDGIKEMPIKEGIFKSLLCDAYSAFKKSRGLQTQDTPYEEAADVCQKELAQRKAITEAKAKAQAAQVQMQAQALQVQQAQIQAQVQAQNQALQPQAIKTGVSAMASTLPFSTLSPRFPGGISPPLLGNSLASSMFLPQLPVNRGRGRPPKAQQNLHTAMMSLIGLPNTNAQPSDAVDPSKRKQMKQLQKQRQPAGNSLNPVVSSIIKDRPALSITTLPNDIPISSTTSASTVSSAPIGACSVLQAPVLSHPRPLPGDQAGWQPKPRQNSSKPINPHLPGTSNSRGSFTTCNTAEMQGASRPKSTSKALPVTSSVSHALHPQSPRPFVPQVRVPLDDPTAILARLPGLQFLKSKDFSTSRHQHQSFDRLQNLHPHQQQLLERSQKSLSHQQPLDRPQKPIAASLQSMSLSKGSTPSAPGMQGNGSARSNELKKSKDASFDVITLD